MINGEPGDPTGTVQLTDGAPCDDINHPPGCQMLPNDVRLPEALLAAGASVEQEDSRGFKALTGQTAFVRLRLGAGADPDLRDREARSAADLAARTRNRALFAGLGTATGTEQAGTAISPRVTAAVYCRPTSRHDT
jgi:hypothetical protein